MNRIDIVSLHFSTLQLTEIVKPRTTTLRFQILLVVHILIRDIWILKKIRTVMDPMIK